MAHVFKNQMSGEYVSAPVPGTKDTFEKVNHLTDEEAETLLKNLPPEDETKEQDVTGENKVARIAEQAKRRISSGRRRSKK